MSKTKILGLIPARGGSKGLPKKNIKIFHGSPLISHSISLAKRASFIDRVFVSTDCDEIACVARDFGAEVPFKRPKSLATDASPEIASWRHFIEYVQKKFQYKIDSLVSIPATSPLRDFNDIDKCIKLFYQEKKSQERIMFQEN